MSLKLLEKYQGKEIKDLKITDKELCFTFEDNSKIEIFDGGQSCCEKRYMNTDDNLEDYIGSKLLDLEGRVASSTKDKYDEPIDCEFLIVHTSYGSFTVANYNEHNGYYGGFDIEAREI